jgi:threonine dehydrogenase-like Zn-dependent dehydrogenase
MPRKIVAEDLSTFRFADYELPPPGARSVRVRVSFGAPKHGTETHAVGGSALTHKKWDPELRLFLPREEDDAPAVTGPRSVGNMVVGTVSEVGPEVTRFAPGDQVFGYGPLCEEHQADEKKWEPLGELTPESAVCADPAHVAFVAVRDGSIRIGDTVAVFGLGAIGLMAVQVARAGGAARVFAVDPVPLRRARAEAFGADATFDPLACDAALEIKLATGRKGVDVAMETSGNSRAFNDAIRCIRQCGTVVHVPWGPRDPSGLHFDQEFHMNRPTVVASQAAAYWGNPDRDYPLWDPERAFAATVELLRAGKITGEGVVTPVIPFEEAPERLAALLAAPAEAIKAGVVFGV